MTSLSVDTFVSKTLQLLQKERDAEIEETRVLTEKLPAKELQRRGVCLLKLHIGSRKTGMFGRVVISFETHLEALPSHSFTPGDIVALNNSSSDSQSEGLGSGIVTRVIQSAINVAFDDSQDLFSLDDGPHDYYKLTKLANDVTYKRLKRTLNSLNNVSHEVCSHLVSVLFGEQPLSPELQIPDLTFNNGHLDESQQDAVKFALSQKEVAIVHGPPGTGKTTTVIEIILQAIKLGNKILACAPSNIAVDNLVERLSRSKHRIVRLGHPARLLPHIQKYSLDAILSTSDETRLVEDVRKDLDKALAGLKKTRHQGERQKLREDMKHLRKELRQREDAATRDILKRADVVLVTLTSATADGPMKLLEESHFDVTIIDEVSQALEAACWIPLLRTRKCILAGDHLQLPPTILSTEAAKSGLEVTLMERLLDLHGDKVMRMLTTQYRMHQNIMRWSSEQLYESKLIAHESVKHHLLKDLENVAEDETTALPLLYIDTAGCDLYELDLPEEISKGNEGEADIVSMHVEKLISSGLSPENIAVIAPYNLQVELIRLRLSQKYPKLEVKSVDGFQGREKEAVVISLVRSNVKREVGFLSEKRRINVAVTRARRHLAVIGDSSTVSSDAFLKTLIDYMNTEGEVHSAYQYLEGGVPASDTNRPDHLDDLLSIKKGPTEKGARPKIPRPSAEKPRQIKNKEHVPKSSERKANSGQTSEINLEEERVIELQSKLQEFQASHNQSSMLEFPATLSARDRFLVHELAEKLGLGHTSKGSGEERHIVVSKPSMEQLPHDTPYEKAFGNGSGITVANDGNESTSITSVTSSINSLSTETMVSRKKKKKNKRINETNEGEVVKENNIEEIESCDQNIGHDKEVDCSQSTNDGRINVGLPSSGKVSCKICGKEVIKANIDLHEIHCARRQKGNQSNAEDKGSSKAKSKDVSASTKHRKFDKELANRVEKVDKDDIDGLIAAVQDMDRFCCFKKCKTSVQTLFQVCAHCEGRYCISHHMPEIHGCGDAARAQARARISKDGVLYRGSGTPDRKPDLAKKAHLQRKLDSKMTELSAKRKGKPKK